MLPPKYPNHEARKAAVREAAKVLAASRAKILAAVHAHIVANHPPTDYDTEAPPDGSSPSVT